MMFAQETEERDVPQKSRSSKSSWRWWGGLLAVCLIGIAAYLFLTKGGRHGDKRAAPTVRSTPVVAMAAKKGDIGVYLTGLGTVTPLNTVTVKTRVDGQLMKVLFREGQVVRSGELLAEIDPRPFQVQLAQAEGQMARDQALLKNARLDLQRFQLLSQQDSIARQQLDTQESLVYQLEGSVKIDQGLIEAARLQLVYSRITAPLGGRVGLRQVDPGNIVHAADTNGMLVITQMQPITVIFPIAEDNLSQVLAKLKEGARLTVEAFDREQKRKLATGTLLTIDNQIDPATGTVKFKAVFSNKENELFPNQFVNARLLVEVKHDTIVVPTSAIQRGPQGTFVYVVKSDKTATVRPITIGVSEGGEVAISAGLTPGEMVVVDGAERLREGGPVEVREPGSGRGSGNAQGPGPGKEHKQGGKPQRPDK